MPRGIAWDDLPTPYNRFDKNRRIQPTTAPVPTPNPEFTVIGDGNEPPVELTSEEKMKQFMGNSKSVGLRVAFGLVCGSITGMVFGTVNALRDSKGMTKRASIVTKQILRSSAGFGG